MSEPMTDKQREYIEVICEWLGMDYEGNDTKESASRFIDKYESEMKRERAIWRNSNT